VAEKNDACLMASLVQSTTISIRISDRTDKATEVLSEVVENSRHQKITNPSLVLPLPFSLNMNTIGCKPADVAPPRKDPITASPSMENSTPPGNPSWKMDNSVFDLTMKSPITSSSSPHCFTNSTATQTKKENTTDHGSNCSQSQPRKLDCSSTELCSTRSPQHQPVLSQNPPLLPLPRQHFRQILPISLPSTSNSIPQPKPSNTTRRKLP
ncbi:UNVERIFIED_CONTAM: hypothetical protein Sindi_2883400, partial [Sesamum indicum]